MLQEDSVERLATAFSGAICGASGKYIPRGARADPKPWALDEELAEAVEERRAARTAVQQDPSPENQAIWKEKKRRARQTSRWQQDSARSGTSPLRS